jgi:5-methylthioadenosine/S-adenosylhomocysteine deaminase
MATRDGAAALHLIDEIGTLENGKAGDVVVVELEEWSGLPGGDPASRVVFGGGPQMVRHVVVAGQPLVVDGRLVSTDTEALRQRIDDAWRATRRRMEEMQ